MIYHIVYSQIFKSFFLLSEWSKIYYSIPDFRIQNVNKEDNQQSLSAKQLIKIKITAYHIQIRMTKYILHTFINFYLIHLSPHLLVLIWKTKKNSNTLNCKKETI